MNISCAEHRRNPISESHILRLPGRIFGAGILSSCSKVVLTTLFVGLCPCLVFIFKYKRFIIFLFLTGVSLLLLWMWSIIVADIICLCYTYASYGSTDLNSRNPNEILLWKHFCLKIMQYYMQFQVLCFH